MKVSLITECGPGIGAGHLMRCLSLCEGFEARGLHPVLWVHSGPGAADFSGDWGGRKIFLFDWHHDREALNKAVEGSDIAIIDSYLADQAAYRAVAEVSKLTVYLDDENRLDYPPGIVVNGAAGAEEVDYPAHEGKRYLLSTPYLPLRKAFWRVPEKSIAEDIGQVLVTFGGSDPRNLTSRILKLLCERYPDWRKTVVIGKDFEHADAIAALKDDRIEWIRCPDAEGMKALMLISDLAVSAGGQTIYECARVGLPLIAVAVSGNQLANAAGGRRAGFLDDAGLWENADLPEKILARIERLRDKAAREKMRDAGRRTVDGLGSLRTTRALLNYYFEHHARIRPARGEDMIDVFSLANDPEIRAFSFFEAGIALEDHKAWYFGKLEDARCFFYVAEAGGLFLGQTRFDVEGRVAVVSIGINKRWRGLGFGKTLLQRALACLKKAGPEIAVVKAHIKVENTVSIHFFESCGFEYLSDLTLENQKAKAFLYRIK